MNSGAFLTPVNSGSGNGALHYITLININVGLCGGSDRTLASIQLGLCEIVILIWFSLDIVY